ncbi:MAG TPA: helix-turn-helix transcriptional regulator [Anaerolineales bacterium]|nr:helix-turn-helix transcriptional regulator [Anaerolineales bacterium]
MSAQDPELSLEVRARLLGALLRDAREHADRSPAACARVLGLDEAEYVAFETGDDSPALPQIELLAYYFDVPVTHFLGDALIVDQPGLRARVPDPAVTELRDRIVAVRLMQARVAAQVSQAELAATIGVPADLLAAFEAGEASIPVPALEPWCRAVGLRIEDLAEPVGVIGAWQARVRQLDRLQSIPAELREFVTQPVNAPYLRLAEKLSHLSTAELREIAATLLDITY